jgi:colanic acid biosynthesis glycosyl transferase WcaI
MPFQPLDSLPWLRASSDVQVSLYKNGAATESFPSKVYEIMASGRPLLASAEGDSEVESVVNTSGCGVCVRPGNTAQLAEAILNLYRNPSLCTTMGRLGRQYAEENHSMRVAVSRYNDLFRTVCG